MNLLILSCGTRVKIVQYFKVELFGKGKVFAADCSPLAPALYEADQYFITPRIDAADYFDELIALCRAHAIQYVVSLIDPEIYLLAQNKEKLIQEGIYPIVEDAPSMQMAFNKLEMHRFLERNNFPSIPTFSCIKDFNESLVFGSVSYPVFVKNRCGSASMNSQFVYNDNDLTHWISNQNKEDVLIQAKMTGDEYGADCYVDLISGELVTVFIRKKLDRRAGVTTKAVSIYDQSMHQFLERFLKVSGLKGVVDIDLFVEGENYFITDINPRFGGTYPHAYACGINIPQLLVNNLEHRANTINFSYETGMCMMLYNEYQVMKINNV